MSLLSRSSVKTDKHSAGGVLGTGKPLYLAAALAAVLAMGGVFALLGSATQVKTYYVLGQDIPVRTPVTAAMLIPRQAAPNAIPLNALDMAYFRDHAVVALVSLKKNDVLSKTVVGPAERISTKLPDTFVVASFQVSAENAVAGKVRSGDYIDVIATDAANGGLSRIVMNHVLVLDVAVAPNSISQSATSGAVGPESLALRTGIPSMYTVGLSPQDATKLAIIRSKDLFLVLSANQVAATVDVATSAGSVFTSPAKDSGAGTDSTTSK